MVNALDDADGDAVSFWLSDQDALPFSWQCTSDIFKP